MMNYKGVRWRWNQISKDTFEVYPVSNPALRQGKVKPFTYVTKRFRYANLKKAIKRKMDSLERSKREKKSL